MDLKVSNLSFGTGYNTGLKKAHKMFAYMLGLGMSAAFLNSCGSGTTQSSNLNGPDTCTITKQPTVAVEKKEIKDEKPLNDVQLNIITNYFREFGQKKQYASEMKYKAIINNKGTKVKIQWVHDDPFSPNTNEGSYDIIKDDYKIKLYKPYIDWRPAEIVIKQCEFGYKVDVFHKVYDDANHVYVIRKTKSLTYDNEGNRIKDSEKANLYAQNIQKTLDKTNFFDQKDTRILSSMLSSWGVKNLEYIDLDGGLEIFADGKDATYDIAIRKSEEDGAYWGIMNKLLNSGNLQSSKNEGSSQTYLFKIKNKSTIETERMVATVMRVVRGDINYDVNDDIDNNKQKYSEASSTHHKVDDYKIARGRAGLFSGGGVAIMATDETTFTSNFLSEGAESLIYTIDGNNQLKVNGRNVYAE